MCLLDGPDFCGPLYYEHKKGGWQSNVLSYGKIFFFWWLYKRKFSRKRLILKTNFYSVVVIQDIFLVLYYAYTIN